MENEDTLVHHKIFSIRIALNWKFLLSVIIFYLFLYLETLLHFRNLFNFLFIFVVMGKAEGHLANEQWHGHVTCVSVAPEFRRLGLAAKLMGGLEDISEQ